MKIQKRAVTACEDMTVVVPEVPTDVDQMTVVVNPTPVTPVEEVPAMVVSPYQPAVDKIMDAIDYLGTIADQPLAKEAIANLSVVLFDLKD